MKIFIETNRIVNKFDANRTLEYQLIGGKGFAALTICQIFYTRTHTAIN